MTQQIRYRVGYTSPSSYCCNPRPLALAFFTGEQFALHSTLARESATTFRRISALGTTCSVMYPASNLYLSTISRKALTLYFS